MKYVSHIIAALASLFLVSPAYTSDLVPFTSGSSFYGSLGTGQINIDTNGRFLINDDSEIVGALVAKQFGAQGKDKYTIAIGEALQSFSLSKYPNCDSKGCLIACLAVDGCSLKPFPIDDIFGMNVYSSESVNPPGCKRTDCETIIEEYPCPTEKEPSKTCTRSRVKCQWKCDADAATGATGLPANDMWFDLWNNSQGTTIVPEYFSTPNSPLFPTMD